MEENHWHIEESLGTREIGRESQKKENEIEERHFHEGFLCF